MFSAKKRSRQFTVSIFAAGGAWELGGAEALIARNILLRSRVFSFFFINLNAPLYVHAIFLVSGTRWISRRRSSWLPQSIPYFFLSLQFNHQFYRRVSPNPDIFRRVRIMNGNTWVLRSIYPIRELCSQSHVLVFSPKFYGIFAEFYRILRISLS